MPREKLGLPTFEAWPEHPLFPVEENEKTPEVVYIQITRIDRGQQLWGPVLRADELTSTDDLFEMYGGGHYELWARGHSKMHADRPGNITKKKRFVLPGRSKPLSKDPTAEELRYAEGVRSSEGTSVPASPAPAPSSSAAPGENLLVAVLNMQQQASQNFMMLMTNMLTESKKESAEAARVASAQQQQFAQMMMQLNGQQQQSMVTIMSALLQNRSGGTDELAKVLKLAREMVPGAAKEGEGESGGDGIGRIMENVADTVAGFVELKKMGGLVAPSNGTPSSPPAPGTAAAVAAEMGGGR